MTGAVELCRTLETLGVDTVFALPGGQNVALFEALRTSKIRTVVATHELGASFMANGYARSSGRPGVLATIPGPGFTYALTGLAEARLDSTPILHILGSPATGPGRRFQLQALDQKTAAAPFVKHFHEVEPGSSIAAAVGEMYALCRSGEPGPVILQLPSAILGAEAPRPGLQPARPLPELAALPGVHAILDRLSRARRPLFFVGQGVFDAARELRELAEGLPAPVITTTSGRGAVPEDHPWVIPFDRGSSDTLNALAESADLILALGVKFSHNGALGFRLRLPADRLVHVDASPEVLGANYDASLSVVADVPSVLRELLTAHGSAGSPAPSNWTREEVSRWRLRAYEGTTRAEPRFASLLRPTAAGFFESLRRAMPPESILVLDSGLHQMLARRHFVALQPRSFLLPTDLQSMGFALPAAIGARLARPGSRVVALLGDGGFAMSGLELLTAVRESISVTAIVFNDGQYGLIRKAQMGASGHAHGIQLLNPDFRRMAEAIGARYTRLEGDAESGLREAMGGEGVCVIEVPLEEPVPDRDIRARAGALVSRLKGLLSD